MEVPEVNMNRTDYWVAAMVFLIAVVISGYLSETDRRITALEARLSATNKAMETLYNSVNRKADRALQTANLARLPGIALKGVRK
jgi:hypothetical protein